MANAVPSREDSRLVRAGTRWVVCAMLFVATSINYMDRQVLGILKPTLSHSIGLTEVHYGYVIAAFQVAYAVGLPLAGWLIDRVGSRVGYAVIMGLWSLASMGHALARSAIGFAVARVTLGLGEAGNFPAAVKTTAEWFPQEERSLATGIFNSGSNVGAILAPAIVPWITLRYGWHAAFLVTGVFGLLWMTWWLLRYRAPKQSAAASSTSTAPQRRLPWRRLLRYRQTWAFSFAKFLTDPIWWFYLYWLPAFFDSRFHLGLSRLGLPLIIVYNVSALGSIAGGYLPGVLQRFKVPAAKARFGAMLCCACLVVPIFLTAHLRSEWLAVALLSVAAGAHQGWSANLYTTVSDMFPASATASVVGLGSTAGSIGGVLLSISAGWILQLTHSYVSLFALAAIVYPVALLGLWLLAPGLRRVDATSA